MIRKAAQASIAIALVFITTTFIPSIAIGSGYLNLSDSVIMIMGWFLGPIVGTLSGIGAAMADLNLGYAAFIPFTLFTKCLTGFIFGSLSKKSTGGVTIILWTIIAMSIMVFTYMLHDLIVLKTFWMPTNIVGNIMQGSVSALIVWSIIFSKHKINTR